MRILMIAACPFPWRRGTPIRIHHMADALLQKGHEVDVVTYPLGDPSFTVHFRIHRVAYRGRHINPEPGPSWTKLAYLDPMLARKVRRLLNAERFDIIHAHHYEGLIAALGANWPFKKPIVYDAHTLLATELPDYRLGLPKALTAWLGARIDRHLPPRADHVIAVTERMRAWFEMKAGIPATRLSLISNGVEYEHFSSPDPETVNRDGRPHVVFAGNLAEYQGVDLLLGAFCHLLREAPDARLTILTASDIAAARAESDRLGLGHHVRFLNPDYESLPARLAEADVLVNPRPGGDGIPQKVLNYMAVGRPIVCFEGSAAGLKHERDALIVPDGDVAAFADAVLRLLGTPQLADRLARSAQELVVSRSWLQVADRVDDVYMRVTNSSL
jgi:glycosyltransferase involved in cell wall biosynthesis